MSKRKFNKKKKLTRSKDGSFKNWKGGKKDSHHGNPTGYGIEWRRQHPRAKPKVGDVVRDKDRDGSYNKGSPWQVRTRHGWRKSPTGTRKPTPSIIQRILKGARLGK